MLELLGQIYIIGVSTMAAASDTKKLHDDFSEIKDLISDVKNNMMTEEDCNNQFYSVIQALDGIVSNLNNIENEKSKPSDEYAVLQTNLLEIRREMSKINTNVDEVIGSGLKEVLLKLSKKIDMLEILNNSTNIDKQAIEKFLDHTAEDISLKIKRAADTLYSQGSSSLDTVKEDITGVNENIRECTEYLEKSWKETTEGTAERISDDITLLGVNLEKSNDNLKRSIIDLFTKIQEELSNEKQNKHVRSAQNVNFAEKDFEMIKNGLSNLNVNTEQHLENIRTIISELDVFKKLESFSKLRNLPAIGELKHTLQNKIDRITDEYSYTLQSSQNRNELNDAAKHFRQDIYDEIISMLSNVSEYLIETPKEKYSAPVSENKYSELKGFADKIEELTSVTELNNSGYDDIIIKLKDVNEKCNGILKIIQDEKKDLLTQENISKALSEIRNGADEILIRTEAIQKQNNEVIRECAQNIIDSSTPDRNEIKTTLADIKRNIMILQSGDEETDYTYSMQDIESDIAKIRIYLNELNQNGISVNTEEYNEEMNGVIVMVDAMKQQLNKIDECNLPDTIGKIKEDLTSISTRVNKLILGSDASYNLIESSLKEFQLLSDDIDNQIKSMSKLDKFDKIEEGISRLKSSFDESRNYNSLINQSLVMLAEWVDNAGETICSISEKQEKLDVVDDIKNLSEETKTLVKESSGVLVSSVQTMLDDTNDLIKNIKINDYSDVLKELEAKTVLQNRRLDEYEKHLCKLDEKLTNILELAIKNSHGELDEKLNDIDLKIEKLNKSIERITSYVNED